MITEINKVISRSKELETLYLNATNINRFKIFQNTTSDIESSRYQQNIKFLYVYQKHQQEPDFPNDYKELAIKKLNQAESYISTQLAKILDDNVMESDHLEKFLSTRLTPLYKGKYRIYPTTTISYLPLKLRLKVYVWLYENETDNETRCHLRNRIAVTLSRLQYLNLANFISVYNWILAQGVSDYFAQDETLRSTVKSIVRHTEKYKNRNFESETGLMQPMAEIYVCFSKVLDEKIFKYDKHYIMCLDLLAVYYEVYKELKVIADLSKTYLRTKDKKVLYQKLTQARLDLIKEAIYLPNQTTGYTIPLATRHQLELYDKLISLCE